MPEVQKASNRSGAAVFWLVAILIWLVVTHPWLLLFPIVFWLCIILPNRPKQVRSRPRPQAITPAPWPRTKVARPPTRTMAPAPMPKAAPQPVRPAAPDFIPKDREYNRSLARTWDEEFEALVKKREQHPQP